MVLTKLKVMTNLYKEIFQLKENYVNKLTNLITNFNEHLDTFIKSDKMFRVYFDEEKKLYIISYYYNVTYPTDAITNNCFYIEINVGGDFVTISHKHDYKLLFTNKIYDNNLRITKNVEELYTKYINNNLKTKTEKYLDPYYYSTLLTIFNQERKTKYKSFSDIDWKYETEFLSMNLLRLFIDYIDWNNVPYNENLTFEFILEHIDKLDMTRLVYFSEKFNHEEFAKIPKKYIDNIDKELIMEYLLDDLSSYSLNDMLEWIEYLAKFNCIDWKKLTSKIEMTQEFITKFNKYWSNEHIIVKSIKVNHN
jgi:hypothetical protein